MALSWTVVIALALVLGVCAEQVNYPAYPEDVREEHQRPDLEVPDATWQAQEGQFPYQLFIRAVAKNGGITTCGGSIIHAQWGLTAAHCTALRTSLIIKAGATNLSNADVIIEAETWYNHPRFIEVLQRVVQPNDISLIKFGVMLEFTDNLRPIQLQRSFEKNHNYENVRMINSGWGNTWTGILSKTVNITQSGMSCTNSQDNKTRTCTKERTYTNRAIAVQLQSHIPEYLNWAYMRGISKEACVKAYNYAVHIQESTLCAVFDEEATQTVCLGDSGGPLTAEDVDGNPVLVGVTSFVSGLGCHTALAPFGFIRPGHYHKWFANVTGINFDDDIWTNNETTTEGNDMTETTSEYSTHEDSSSETTWSTAHPTEESSSEQTTAIISTTEESYSSTTDEATTPEQTTESSTDSSTTLPIEETTETTIDSEELYPSTTALPTTTEPPCSSSQSSELSTESSTDLSTIEITTKTTHVTEESSTTEGPTTTESPSSSQETLSSEPSFESSTYASTSQPVEETTLPGLEESDTITTEEPTTTEQPTCKNETTSSETATQSSTQPITETTTTSVLEETTSSSAEDSNTPDSPTSTNEQSTSQETTKTDENTILDISFTRPNFETTV